MPDEIGELTDEERKEEETYRRQLIASHGYTMQEYDQHHNPGFKKASE